MSSCAVSQFSVLATTDEIAPAVSATRSFERALQISCAAAFSEIPMIAPISTYERPATSRSASTSRWRGGSWAFASRTDS